MENICYIFCLAGSRHGITHFLVDSGLNFAEPVGFLEVEAWASLKEEGNLSEELGSDQSPTRQPEAPCDSHCPRHPTCTNLLALTTTR